MHLYGPFMSYNTIMEDGVMCALLRDISTGLRAAQPVSVLIPHRETSSDVVTNYETEIHSASNDGGIFLSFMRS